MRSQVEYLVWVIDRYKPGIETSHGVLHSCKKCGAIVAQDDLELHDERHTKQAMHYHDNEGLA